MSLEYNSEQNPYGTFLKPFLDCYCMTMKHASPPSGDIRDIAGYMKRA